MENKNEAEIVMDMTKQYPNDADLGKEYRNFCLSYKGGLDEFSSKYPNDMDLGKFLRKKVSK